MNYPKEYDQYSNLRMDELAEIMGGHEELKSKANIARLVYEEKQRDEKRKYDADQTQLQHKLNKENIELQHSLNAQIVSKQLRLMKWSTIITSVSTLIAALAGAYLAYALMQVGKPIQTKLDSRPAIQSQTKPSTSETHYERKGDKETLKPPR